MASRFRTHLNKGLATAVSIVAVLAALVVALGAYGRYMMSLNILPETITIALLGVAGLTPWLWSDRRAAMIFTSLLLMSIGLIQTAFVLSGAIDPAVRAIPWWHSALLFIFLAMPPLVIGWLCLRFVRTRD